MDATQSLLLDLGQLIPIVNHWFHLLSAIIWIGGLAFLVMVLTPSLQTAVPREYVKPVVDAIYVRYKKIVGALLAVLLFTGGINLHYVNRLLVSQTGDGIPHHIKYLTVFFIKLFLVLGILTLFLYTVIFRTERTGEETEEEREEQFQEPIPFQKLAFWTGVFIILCAAALKHLHQ